MPRETKTCYVCKEEKDRTAFHKNKSQPDGLDRRCRRCRNLGLTLKELTGVHGKKTDLSDLTPGRYKKDTFESILRRLCEIEDEAKVSQSHKIALETAAKDLLIASKKNTYSHPAYGTMCIKNDKLEVLLKEDFEEMDRDE